MSDDPRARLVVRVRNSTAAPLPLLVEPWADEHELAASTSIDIVEVGGLADDVLELEIEPGRVRIYARGRAVMTVLGGER